MKAKYTKKKTEEKIVEILKNNTMEFASAIEHRARWIANKIIEEVFEDA